MRYVIEINNFINSEELTKLRNQVNALDFNKNSKVMVNRFRIQNSDNDFNKIITNNSSINQFYNNLNNKNFLLNLIDTFNKKYNKDFTIFKNINFIQKPNNYFVNYKTIKNLSSYRLYNNLFKKNFHLSFDISKSGENYYRELHRDTNNRYIVFLYYLNTIDHKAGGELVFKSNYLRDKIIKTKENKLVCFVSNKFSHHMVNPIKSDIKRLFFYGAFSSQCLINEDVDKI